MVRPSQSGWGVDDGNAAFLWGGYDKGVFVEGFTRAVKKAASSSLPPSSESPPGGRGNREAAAPEGAVSRDGGGERGEEVPCRGVGCGCAPFRQQRALVLVVVPGVEGWVEGGVLLLGDKCREEEEEEVGGGGGGGGGGRGERRG